LFSEQPRALRRLLDRRNRRGDQPTAIDASDSLIFPGLGGHWNNAARYEIVD
jgi:hypothetical protein